MQPMDGPSTSGYRPFANYEPRSRDERVNARDHTALEKARIAARSYGRAEPPPANVLIPQTNSPLYCDDHSRFGAPDAATLEYQRRQEQLKRQEEIYERKRAEHYWKEKGRWDRQDQVFNRHENVLNTKRDMGEGGVRRNASSESYNIISLEYARNAEGQRLKDKDEATQYKAQLRAANLYAKGHSVTHNIITGHPLYAPVPAQQAQPQAYPGPQAPWDR